MQMVMVESDGGHILKFILHLVHGEFIEMRVISIVLLVHLYRSIIALNILIGL